MRPDQTSHWADLQAHRDDIGDDSVAEAFRNDPERQRKLLLATGAIEALSGPAQRQRIE